MVSLHFVALAVTEPGRHDSESFAAAAVSASSSELSVDWTVPRYRVVPFDVEMGEVGTFLPTTPTVFIQVKRAAYRMRELHDQLSVKALHCDEPWPYIPHLTILKTDLDQQARDAAVAAQRRWDQFPGSRTIHVDELMFVRETGGVWQDVAPVPLGRSLLSARS